MIIYLARVCQHYLLDMTCLNLPEGLIVRKTFIDVLSNPCETRRTKSCPARVCHVNNDLINDMIAWTCSINNQMDLLILEARLQIVCARRMLQQLPTDRGRFLLGFDLPTEYTPTNVSMRNICSTHFLRF